MSASQKTAFEFYTNAAATLDASKTPAQLKKALKALDDSYSADDLSTTEKIVAEAKSARTALLHRARAVKSTAKRQAAKKAA